MSKIIVIGSGFGGLSAAVRLAARGHQVELFEKQDKLGGRVYVYEIDGPAPATVQVHSPTVSAVTTRTAPAAPSDTPPAGG